MAQAKKTPAKKAPVKKEKPAAVEAPTVNIGEESYATPPMPQKPQKAKWEYRDRLYELTSLRKPIIFVLPAMHSRRKPLLWFDPEKGYQRELRYATNQKSVFVDEQEGPVTLG